MRAHLQLAHTHDAERWRERHAAGLVPDRLPYGLDHLEQHGVELDVLDVTRSPAMQRIVGDRLRPADKKDPAGVEQSLFDMQTALDLVDRDMEHGGWATGMTFTMADCAAAPALFYANEVAPFGDDHPGAKRYLERLAARPCFMRVLAEAEPYFKMFPRN